MIRKFLKFAKSESAKNPYFIRVLQTGNGHFEATPYPASFVKAILWTQNCNNFAIYIAFQSAFPLPKNS